jgi:glutathione synthase/RimK-type ligase-like ATP-grasp enzyme
MDKIKHIISKIYFFISKISVCFRSEFRVLPIYVRKKRRANVGIFAPRWFRQHFRAESNWKRACMISLVKRNVDFVICTSIKEVQPDQKLIWYPTQGAFKRKVRYTSYPIERIIEMAKEVEGRGAQLYPNSEVISYQENKIKMYRMLKRLDVNIPQTIAVNSFEGYEFAISQVGYPFIVKGPFSNNSKHLVRILTEDEASVFAEFIFSNQDKQGMGNSDFPIKNLPVLIQKFVNLRKDMRVIFVGDEILSKYSYWRINNSNGWRPTATRYGSVVVFSPFPRQWEDYIREVIKKIDFPWGAFDIAWDHDDLSTEPLILEVSPGFSPNPPPPQRYINNYYDFKFKVNLRDNWHHHFWETIKDIADAQVSYFLKV